jgi:hypothetical protein
VLAKHVAREREYQRSILALHKKLDAFHRKYPQSGFKAVKAPRFALLEDDRDNDNDDDNATAAAGKKRKKATKREVDDDDDDLSLEGGLDKAESPAVTRSAIKRKAGKSSGKKASGKSSSQAAPASQTTVESDSIKKIVFKALAYGLVIYQCDWVSGSVTWEFPCDLVGEGYAAMIDAFNKAWGVRVVENLDESKWPKQTPGADLVPHALLDMGYCKNDTSLLVQWQSGEATWERITDMYVYGFGKLVKKFLKAWGNKPIRNVVLDEQQQEVPDSPYRPARQSKREAAAAAVTEASLPKVKQEPVEPAAKKAAPSKKAKAAAAAVAAAAEAAAAAATLPESSPHANAEGGERERELEEEPIGDADEESAELMSETEESGPSLSDHESDDAEGAEDDDSVPASAAAHKGQKITAKVLKTIAGQHRK